MLVRAPYWFNYDAVDITIWREGLTDSVSSSYLRVFTLLACVPIALGAIYLARRFRDHPLGRRPVLAQHILCFLLIGLAASNLLGGMTQVVLWSVTAVFAAYFWFLAYALIDQRRRQPAPLLYHLANFHPFFALTTVVPMGKDAANWQKVEAATAEELAVTQLKALKLIAWRSEEHTSELQSLMRISYAVFCLKKKKNKINTINQIKHHQQHTIIHTQQ